jgi:hypothetical protein
VRIIVEVVALQTLKGFSGSPHSSRIVQHSSLLFASALTQTGSHCFFLDLVTYSQNEFLKTLTLSNDTSDLIK